MVKAKFEYFQNQNRMRFFAIKVLPLNLGLENKELLRRLDTYKLMTHTIQPQYHQKY